MALRKSIGCLRVKVIDLTTDFRLKDDANWASQKFVYGLPELNKTAIQSAQYIANPGCFATAITLGLLPLAKAGMLGDVYTTGITGSTGVLGKVYHLVAILAGVQIISRLIKPRNINTLQKSIKALNN
jgi:N-acetyl-gamma-glutamylphosphate reductase